ncbi:MAG: CinA family protein [Henriciella sp.]|nr:CinA family protein [Henriciella sp.]
MQSLLPLAHTVAEHLKRRGETVAISESSSGGLISAALLAVPGASTYYRGGGVIYTPQAFRGLMGLERDDLKGMRSSSEPYALFMAGQIRGKLRADWGLCETGAAGPTGNGYGDATGHTCTGLVGEAVQTAKTLETGLADREANMRLFAKAALEHLLEAIS